MLDTNSLLGRHRLMLYGVASALLVSLVMFGQTVADGSPLSLQVRASHEICTADSLTEVTWDINGGSAPYVLAVDGNRIPSGHTSADVQCGPLPPVKPGETPTRTINALVTDAGGQTLSATVRVAVAPALSAPRLATHHIFQHTLVHVIYTQAYSTWTRGVSSNQLEREAPFYLGRWRIVGTESWSYKLLRVDYQSWHPMPEIQTEFPVLNLEPWTKFEMGVAALRSAVEQQAPDVLSWSQTLMLTTLQTPQNVQVSASHDTVTVSWDAQPDETLWDLQIRGPDGERYKGLFVEQGSTGQHTYTFRGLPSQTTYTVRVNNSEPLAETLPPGTLGYVEQEVQTGTAPPGTKPLPRGPQNVRIRALGDAIRVTWDRPHDIDEGDFLVSLVLDGRRIDSEFIPFDYPTTVTFSGLQPQTAYRVTVHQGGIVVKQVVRNVRTAASEQARVQSGEVPFPVRW